MNIRPYYEHYNRNVGRIKNILQDDVLTINVNAGHGGGEMTAQFYCYNFQPSIDDRILLCYDDEGEVEGLILQKLNKNRQND